MSRSVTGQVLGRVSEGSHDVTCAPLGLSWHLSIYVMILALDHQMIWVSLKHAHLLGVQNYD